MIALVAALASNGCIGANGKLPWCLPEDFARFKALTIGKVVLMGRKTWESLPDRFRPLPGRVNVVITRQPAYAVPEEVATFPSIADALTALDGREVMVIGGAEIYAQAIHRADALHLTHVHRDVPGDAFFPSIDPAVWHTAEREDHDGFSFVTYTRRVNG